MKLKKGDKAILLVILIFFLLSTALTFYNKDGSDNKEALIEVDGKVIKIIKLSQDMEKEEFHFEIDDNKSFNVVAEEGKIKMEQSTCPNQICVKTGEISEVGESIICLPYKTGIYIEEVGGEEY
mgnify:FL=1